LDKEVVSLEKGIGISWYIVQQIIYGYLNEHILINHVGKIWWRIHVCLQSNFREITHYFKTEMPHLCSHESEMASDLEWLPAIIVSF
jgi:hypothetical protein